MVNPRATISRRWPLVHNKTGRLLSPLNTLLKNIIISPQFENIFLKLWEISSATYRLEHPEPPLHEIQKSLALKGRDSLFPRYHPNSPVSKTEALFQALVYAPVRITVDETDQVY
jgi:hypothetical protein